MNTPPVRPPPPVNGEGSYTYSNGDVYTGSFFNSLRHGYGKCIFSEGSIYEGDWNNDQCHGNGKLQSKDFTYVGEFKNGKKNGNGVGTWTVGK
jgi:hypothetical protein